MMKILNDFGHEMKSNVVRNTTSTKAGKRMSKGNGSQSAAERDALQPLEEGRQREREARGGGSPDAGYAA